MKTDLRFTKELIEQTFKITVELEYQFAKAEGRKWRFDLALPAEKLALEVDGGLFVHGGHTRGLQITKTHEKENRACILGWRILKCQPKDVGSGRAFSLIAEALGRPMQ